MLFHIDNNLIFSFSPSNISSSSLSLKSLYSLDFCLIAFLNRLELELALPGEPAAMLEFCFRVFLGPYARASLSPLNQEHQATTAGSQSLTLVPSVFVPLDQRWSRQASMRSKGRKLEKRDWQPLRSGLAPVGAVRAATRETKQQPSYSYRDSYSNKEF